MWHSLYRYPTGACKEGQQRCADGDCKNECEEEEDKEEEEEKEEEAGGKIICSLIKSAQSMDILITPRPNLHMS